MRFESLWAASRTVDACRRVCNGCPTCLRGGPSRSALLWFECSGKHGAASVCCRRRLVIASAGHRFAQKSKRARIKVDLSRPTDTRDHPHWVELGRSAVLAGLRAGPGTGLLDYGYRGHRLFGHSGDIEGALDFLSDKLLRWSERPDSAKSSPSQGRNQKPRLAR